MLSPSPCRSGASSDPQTAQETRSRDSSGQQAGQDLRSQQEQRKPDGVGLLVFIVRRDLGEPIRTAAPAMRQGTAPEGAKERYQEPQQLRQSDRQQQPPKSFGKYA